MPLIILFSHSLFLSPINYTGSGYALQSPDSPENGDITDASEKEIGNDL